MQDAIQIIFLIIAVSVIALTIITYWWNRKIAEAMRDLHIELELMNNRLEHIVKIISKKNEV